MVTWPWSRGGREGKFKIVFVFKSGSLGDGYVVCGTRRVVNLRVDGDSGACYVVCGTFWNMKYTCIIVYLIRWLSV